MIGAVLFWNAEGRFGKIIGAADREIYFVHFTELIDVLDLRTAQRVAFQPTIAADGLRAVSVRPVELQAMR